MHIFADRVTHKMHILKEFSQKTKASSILSHIMVDWLNQAQANNANGKKEIKHDHKQIYKQETKDDIRIESTHRTLVKTQQTKSTTTMRTVRGKTPSKSIEKLETERLLKEKQYLMQVQQETDQKIEKIRNINNDLVKEYNHLFDKGKNIYNAFFELYYAVKLESSKKFAKLPITDEEVEAMKVFLDHNKLKPHDGTFKLDNLMENLINKSRKQIIKQ